MHLTIITCSQASVKPWGMMTLSTSAGQTLQTDTHYTFGHHETRQSDASQIKPAPALQRIDPSAVPPADAGLRPNKLPAGLANQKASHLCENNTCPPVAQATMCRLMQLHPWPQHTAFGPPTGVVGIRTGAWPHTPACLNSCPGTWPHCTHLNIHTCACRWASCKERG